MKLRYLLPFYALLIAVSFCCRKISNEKEEAAKAEKKAAAAETLMSASRPITGMLELDEATDMIYADLTISVPSRDFKYAENFMPLQSKEGFKGVTFRYFDASNNTKDTGNGTVPLRITFSFKNDNKWVENDSVRVMSLNEDDETTFIGLKPYFENRMDYFKNSPVTYSALEIFNEDWNKKYPNNTVATGEKTGNKKQHFLPRITRDDSILSLKLKK